MRAVPRPRRSSSLRPALIVALGKTAATRLLGTEASLASLRGRVHRYRGIPVIVTYHPAYLLRSLAGEVEGVGRPAARTEHAANARIIDAMKSDPLIRCNPCGRAVREPSFARAALGARRHQPRADRQEAGEARRDAGAFPHRDAVRGRRRRPRGGRGRQQRLSPRPPFRCPRSTSGAGFSIERIAKLKPDLVLAWRDGIKREDADRMTAAGAHVFVASARQLEDVSRLMHDHRPAHGARCEQGGGDLREQARPAAARECIQGEAHHLPRDLEPAAHHHRRGLLPQRGARNLSRRTTFLPTAAAPHPRSPSRTWRRATPSSSSATARRRARRSSAPTGRCARR